MNEYDFDVFMITLLFEFVGLNIITFFTSLKVLECKIKNMWIYNIFAKVMNVFDWMFVL